MAAMSDGDPDRRSPSTAALIKWIGLIVGLFSIVGVLVGAAVTFGQHLAMDQQQADRLTKLEQRVLDLERASLHYHADPERLPNRGDAPKNKDKP
jgi:hypothetical protein